MTPSMAAKAEGFFGAGDMQEAAGLMNGTRDANDAEKAGG